MPLFIYLKKNICSSFVFVWSVMAVQTLIKLSCYAELLSSTIKLKWKIEKTLPCPDCWNQAPENIR